MKRYRWRFKSGGGEWNIFADKKLSKNEVSDAFAAELKEGRAREGKLGLIATVRGPGMGRGERVILMPLFLRRYNLLPQEDFEEFCKTIGVSPSRWKFSQDGN